MGTIPTERMIYLYNASDIFVTSSLQENLPNTIMEAMSCGVPVVAFQTGGIPEMIDHLQNGWLAEYKSSYLLAEGMYWCLYQAQYEQLCINARNKVLQCYSPQKIAEAYIAIYNKLL